MPCSLRGSNGLAKRRASSRCVIARALLKYSDDPNATLKYLTQQLRLNFNHQREIPQTQRDLPTRLDPKLVSTDRLIQLALSRHSNTGGFSDAGLRLLAGRKLTKLQRRHLLERLRHPDYPNLVDLIISDLKERDSRGFGSMPIHRSLTLAQLGDLADKYPKMKSETRYVDIYLSKLQPSDDVNWHADPTEHRKYLDRLWGLSNHSIRVSIRSRHASCFVALNSIARKRNMTGTSLWNTCDSRGTLSISIQSWSRMFVNAIRLSILVPTTPIVSRFLRSTMTKR